MPAEQLSKGIGENIAKRTEDLQWCWVWPEFWCYVLLHHVYIQMQLCGRIVCWLWQK